MSPNEVSQLCECLAAIRRELVALANKVSADEVYECEYNDGVIAAYTVIADIINETAGSLFNGRFSCPSIDSDRQAKDVRKNWTIIKGGKKQ